MSSQTIMDIAWKHFSEKGYDGTSLAEIADEAGIKKPSIYAHYESKMNLFMTIVEQAMHQYCDAWREALIKTAALNEDERLYVLFSAISRSFVGDRVKMAFWVRLWMFSPIECRSEILKSLKKTNSEFIDEIAAIIQHGMERGLFRHASAKEMAHAYFCLLDGYLMRAICYDDFDYKETMAELWSCFLLGIKR